MRKPDLTDLKKVADLLSRREEQGDDGRFYVVALIPDVDPRRLKLGFARDVNARLAEHRCTNPQAALVYSWPCRRSWERLVMDAMTCCFRQLGREVYECSDREDLIAAGCALFCLLPPVGVETAEDMREALRLCDEWVEIVRANSRRMREEYTALLPFWGSGKTMEEALAAQEVCQRLEKSFRDYEAVREGINPVFLDSAPGDAMLDALRQRARHTQEDLDELRRDIEDLAQARPELADRLRQSLKDAFG